MVEFQWKDRWASVSVDAICVAAGFFAFWFMLMCFAVGGDEACDALRKVEVFLIVDS